jgi:hypothetical protein
VSKYDYDIENLRLLYVLWLADLPRKLEHWRKWDKVLATHFKRTRGELFIIPAATKKAKADFLVRRKIDPSKVPP